MSIEAETEAKELVALIRTQVAGKLVVDEFDAIRLVLTALSVAEHRGCIDGMERISRAFPQKAA